jgi:hypothetical protein
MNPDHSFECNAPDVVFENFGDEAVILNLQSGDYYSLVGVGMLYWECLSQGVPPSQITAHICARYSASVDETEIVSDLGELLAQLQSEGLIRSSNTSRALAELIGATAALPPAYAAPMLSKFDDVAEMLLLDPVHDVSEVGWPHPSPAAGAPGAQDAGAQEE